jgi:hypothetical protein
VLDRAFLTDVARAPRLDQLEAMIVSDRAPIEYRDP